VISHPAIGVFLQIKWNRIRYFYFTDILFQLILAVSWLYFTNFTISRSQNDDEWQNFIPLVFSAYIFLREILDLAIFGLKSYFLSVENWLSLSLASMGMLIFCAKSGLVETLPKEKQILILASGNILAFLVVMLHCNRHPLLSVYTTRYVNIFLKTDKMFFFI
jgi:hypothetical protein